MAYATWEHGYHDRTRDKEIENRAVNEKTQRRYYGGFNLGAAFFGWLVSTGIAVLVTALLAGAGSAIAFTSIKNVTSSGIANNAATIGFASGLLLLIALAISYYAGGYVAGRMSRFDGAKQGVGVWVIGIIVTLILGGAGAIFGAKYNALQQINLPHIPISQGALTRGGLIALILTIAVTLLAAMFGGMVGERYHRKVDRAGAV